MWFAACHIIKKKIVGLENTSRKHSAGRLGEQNVDSLHVIVILGISPHQELTVDTYILVKSLLLKFG